jgi:hypothetical protein
MRPDADFNRNSDKSLHRTCLRDADKARHGPATPERRSEVLMIVSSENYERGGAIRAECSRWD